MLIQAGLDHLDVVVALTDYTGKPRTAVNKTTVGFFFPLILGYPLYDYYSIVPNTGQQSNKIWPIIILS